MASLIMCMESVFAVLAAMVLLGDVMSGREIFGCVVMFVAITLPQIVTIVKERKNR
jgi:drug/metabolite transporter (DMT)-like permease